MCVTSTQQGFPKYPSKLDSSGLSTLRYPTDLDEYQNSIKQPWAWAEVSSVVNRGKLQQERSRFLNRQRIQLCKEAMI